MESDMKKVLAPAALAIAACYSGASLPDIIQPVNGIRSYDSYGDPDNVSFAIDPDSLLGNHSNYVLVGIGWEVTLQADMPSWLSEIHVGFSNTSGTDIIHLNPGAADPFTGVRSYSSGGVLALNPTLRVHLDSDDLLQVEFFEDYDDHPNDWDGIWLSGNLTLRFEGEPVPEPATMAALGLGLAAVARRRRSK